MFNHFKLYTAGLIGLPDLLPAYLDPKFHGPRILTGASFASAGAGYYDITPLSVVSICSFLKFISRHFFSLFKNFSFQSSSKFVQDVLPLGKQVEDFRHYRRQLSHLIGAKNASRIISKGLFVFYKHGN
jgi:hypothetical protein